MGNKQPSLPVARPALSSSSPLPNILFLLLVDYCYIVFTYRVSYLLGIVVKIISRKKIEIFVKMISRKKGSKLYTVSQDIKKSPEKLISRNFLYIKNFVKSNFSI